MLQQPSKSIETYSQAKQWLIQELSGVTDAQEAGSMFKNMVTELTEIPYSSVQVHLADRVTKPFLAQLIAIAKKLKQGHPLQYILNKAYFCDISLVLDNAVLIPRPETEELVYLVVARLGANFKGKIIDLGTGSGCIAIALKQMLPMADIVGVDASEAAIKVARKNATLNKVSVTFYTQKMEDSTIEDFDVVVSNPPYIDVTEEEDMEYHVTGFEPKMALFAPPEDPLYFYRIIAVAVAGSSKSKFCFLELNANNASDTRDMYTAYFSRVELITDLSGKQRMLYATK